MALRELKIAIVAVFFLGGMSSQCVAQMNNRPFEFGSVTGNARGESTGMSAAARTVILEQKLTGNTPANVLAGANGEVITITPGPGRIAIARRSDGTVVPGFRGSVTPSFETRSVALLFSPSGRGIGSAFLARPSTGIALTGWIAMIAGDGPAANLSLTGVTIDEWTRQVYGG